MLPAREARRRPGEPGRASTRRPATTSPGWCSTGSPTGPGRPAVAAIATRRPCWRSAPRGQELVLAKPQTYMNDSGRAVRRLLQSYHVPLVDLLVVADDFALPFGKLRFREAGSHGGHNGLRSIIGELNSEKFSRLRVGIGEPGRGAVDHVLSRFTADETARLPILLDASAEAVEAWVREGTSKAANRFNAWELQAPAAADAEDDADRPSRARWAGPPMPTACAGRRPAGGGSCPAATGRIARRAVGRERPVPRPDDPPAEHRRQGRPGVGRATGRRRGPRGGDRSRRRLGGGRGRAARSRRPGRHATATAPPPHGTRRRARSRRRRRADGRRAEAPAVACRTSPRCRGCSTTPARSVACGSGSAPVEAPGMHGRHVGLTSVPHGAKSYLAAALALAAGGERVCWVARDAEIGDRVAEELGRVAGRPVAGRRARAADLARLRALRAGARRDRGPRRGARRVALRHGEGPGRERPGAAPGDARARTTSRRSCATLKRRDADRRWTRCSPSCRASATRRSSRSRAAASSPAAAASSTCSRRAPPLPIRIEFFGDEIDSLRAFDPTDQRSVETVARPHPAAGDGVPAAARRRRRDPGPARPARRRGCRSGWRSTSPGSPATRDPERPGRGGDRRPRARRRRRGRGLVPAHRAVDRPRPPRPGHPVRARRARRPRRRRPPSCGARPRSGTRELVEQGELPRDWPTGYLPPTRLEARASTARGRWSSPGSPRRPRRRAWRTRRRA